MESERPTAEEKEAIRQILEEKKEEVRRENIRSERDYENELFTNPSLLIEVDEEQEKINVIPLITEDTNPVLFGEMLYRMVNDQNFSIQILRSMNEYCRDAGLMDVYSEIVAVWRSLTRRNDVVVKPTEVFGMQQEQSHDD